MADFPGQKLCTDAMHFDEHLFIARPDRKDGNAAIHELAQEQVPGQPRRTSGDQDAVERAALRPAQRAVAQAEMHVASFSSMSRSKAASSSGFTRSTE